MSEEDLAGETDAQVEAASAATMGSVEDTSSQKLFAQEQTLLEEMTGIAEQAAGTRAAQHVYFRKKNFFLLNIHRC